MAVVKLCGGLVKYREHLLLPLEPGFGGQYIKATSDVGGCITYGMTFPEDTDESSITGFECGLQQTSEHSNEEEYVWTDGQRVALRINVPDGIKRVFTSKPGYFDLQLWSQDGKPIGIFRVTNTPPKLKGNYNGQEGNSHIPALGSEAYKHQKGHEERRMIEHILSGVRKSLIPPTS
jgi:hypothetical protein